MIVKINLLTTLNTSEPMKNTRKFFAKLTRTGGVALLFAATLLLGCKKKDDTPAPTGPGNIVQVAQADARFSTLVAAVTKANLGTTLTGTGPFTVFAPTNDAFAALPAALPFNNAAEINAITDQATMNDLRNILLYHVLGSRVAAANIANGSSTATTAKTPAPNTIYLSKNGAGVFINGNSKVVVADVAASNGVIHAIDRVLLPPTQTLAQLVAASAGANPAQFTVLLRALSRPAAGELLAAAGAAGSNLTVFAPTDAAFTALLADLEKTSLDQVDDATLVAILRKHIVGSRVFSTDLVSGNVTTLNGTVTVAVNTSGVTVRGPGNATNNANVVTANVLATNGVVHVIDRVLRP
jgi:uncharacterized surface protein with fasciclin (FAS1) repeats